MLLSLFRGGEKGGRRGEMREGGHEKEERTKKLKKKKKKKKKKTVSLSLSLFLHFSPRGQAPPRRLRAP